MTSTPSYHCIVCTLTKISFASLSKDSQQQIVKSGQPTDHMPNLLAKYQSAISSNNWITGCDKNQSLYCWPCLLFNTSEYDVWGKRGFTDFRRLSQAIVEHSRDVNHQAKSVTLKLWIENASSDADDSDSSEAVEEEEEVECIPELDFLDSNLPEEELDIKPNVEALNASPSSSSQQAVTAILDLCDPSGIKEIEVARTSPIIIRDTSPVPSHSGETLVESNPSHDSMICVPRSEPVNVQHEPQQEEIAKIYRDVSDVSQSAGVNSADKYQLKWHSHQQNLNSSISCLYRNDRYADVTLITCNNEESFAIPAHKLVLGSSSTYFANIFDKTVAPLNAMTYIVLPSELTKRSMQTLIQYMYTGESTVSVDILNEVLRGGEILKIRGLWRNQSGTDGAPEQPSGKENEQHHSRHRTERISIDRVPLQEPQRSTQGSVVVHDSPVIVTNPAKTYNVSHASTSSSNPMINVKRDVAVDPGDRSKSVPEGSTNKRSHTAMNQENSIQGARQHIPAKITSPRAALANAENLPNSRNTGTQKMPEALNFLNVKEEPVEWTDVPPEEINIDKASFPTVKVELRETTNLAHESGGESTSQEQVYSPLTCELCSETFTIPAEWVRHIESHSDPPHTVSKRRRRVDDDDEADVTAALKCDLCAMYFVTPAEWVRHVQSTHTETELAMSNNSSLRRQSSKTYTSDAQSSLVTQLVAHQQQQQQQQEKTCSARDRSTARSVTKDSM
ncbi:uncharacterized protein LOC129751434 isoform X4 [Uranotaenia lowii]|uniref:uncharacterized protein LOC129751434 isoform X4 n=1 Tax=Uranotaenia lowii TaxID=190385 RepID=UPI00247882FA|nr:uncharacterized protein LOC129751434 isoform X4 [Uranotaenia lowii]